MIIDTHTHLETFARAGTLAAALARAREAGLERMISIGTSPDDWALYRQLASEHRGLVEYSVGLHPCAVEESWPTALAQVEAFWQSNPVPVALGEIGLDRFHLPKNDPVEAERIFGWQREAFAAGLKIAGKLGARVVVHSRGAFAECVQMIDEAGVDWRKVVFHCFTEGAAEMRELKTRGGFGSFTGILTYKTAGNVREAAREQGLDRLMIETDAPYLTPMPHRGKPNEPAFLRHTAEFAATLFEVPFETLAKTTTGNARRFFGLG
jgi:TatD DNase family protein